MLSVHGPELALEEPGCADVWELILALVFLKSLCAGVLLAPFIGRCFER